MHQLHIRKLLNLKLELTFYCSRTKDYNHVLIALIFITVDLFIFVCPVNLLSQVKTTKKTDQYKVKKKHESSLP